jgi:hypothetical protein
MAAEFGIINEPCYFCSQPSIIKFSEHYYFCPECSSIYTKNIVFESSCDHIKDGIPTIVRKPWFKKVMEGKAYITDGEYYSFGKINDKQVCSICNARCEAHGW